MNLKISQINIEISEVNQNQFNECIISHKHDSTIYSNKCNQLISISFEEEMHK
jgi:hypothetical protein